MVNLDSLFDVDGHDPHKNAQAGLTSVFHVEGAASPYDSLPASGTPVAGDIFRGAIIVMNANGNVVLADNANALTDAPCMLWVTVDGDQDYDGAFVHNITCIQGGAEYTLDVTNFVAGSYAPGDLLSCGSGAEAGLFRAVASGEQIYGQVGARGQDTTNNTLRIIVPQGISPALA